MSFDFGPEMGLHILTYHHRQVNHHYLPNPGDLLTVDRGKISPKLCKKVSSKSGRKKKKSVIDVVFLQWVLLEITF